MYSVDSELTSTAGIKQGATLSEYLSAGEQHMWEIAI